MSKVSTNLKNVEKAALQQELELYTSLLSKHDKILQASKKQAIKQHNSKTIFAQHMSVKRGRAASLFPARYPSSSTYINPKPLYVNNTDRKKKVTCDKFKNQFSSFAFKNNSPRQAMLTKDKVTVLPHSPLKTQANKRLAQFNKTNVSFQAKTLINNSTGNLKGNNKTVAQFGELNTKTTVNGVKKAQSKEQMLIKANSQKLNNDIHALKLLIEKHSSKNESLKSKNLPGHDTDNCDSLTKQIFPLTTLKNTVCKEKSMLKSLDRTLGSKKSTEVPSILENEINVKSEKESKSEVSLIVPSSSKTPNSSLNTPKIEKSLKKAKRRSSVKNKFRDNLSFSAIKRVAKSNQASLAKIENALKALQSKAAIPKPRKSITKPLANTKQITDNKLVATKYKVVNKKNPAIQTFKCKISPKTALNVASTPVLCKSNQTKYVMKSGSKTPILTRRLLNSKYRVINKAKTPAKKISDSSCNQNFGINLNQTCSKKRKTSLNTYVFKKAGMNLSTPVKVAQPKSLIKHKQFKFVKHNTLSGSNWKSFTNVNSQTPRNFVNSKYKFICKPNAHMKNNKVLRISSSRLSSIDVDVDLLLELAEEKKLLESKTTDKSVLLKRIFKSRRAIVNKNVNSAQTKVAKMIKTKYSTFSKKKVWHKNFSPRNFNSHNQYKGNMPNTPFQRRNPTSSFCNQRNRRNSIYATPFSRSYQRNVSSWPNKFAGSSSTPHYRPLSKASRNHSDMKYKTPISKVIASRVLNRSINTALSASVKKNTTKNNVYCMFYNRFGRCNKGLKCSYIHDPRRIAVCTRYLRGTCKIENCPFSHEINPGKMAICSFFLLGSCTKDNCPYRHETLSPDSKLCKAFVQGYCPEGKDCKNAHVLVCPQFIQGCCDKGNKCAFPHPPSKGKKIVPKVNEKEENPQQDKGDLLVEKVSRYFQPLTEKIHCEESTGNSVVPKRAKLDEQPSFIALSLDE